MADLVRIKLEAELMRDRFVAGGATPVHAPVLLPADTLLDLYGEDIRARAFLTQDPPMGEWVLRPDFTVPVAQMHLASGRAEGRYAYAGEVFRRQEEDPSRASEYFQAGFEVFGGADPAAAEAEVFATIRSALGAHVLKAAMGDIGFLVAAVEGLETPERRKAALRRHLWHPPRFRALIERYAHPAPPPPAAGSPGLTHVGLRTPEEIEARLAALAEEARTPPIARAERARIDAIVAVRATAPAALAELRRIAGADAALGAACDRLEARLEALGARGIDPGGLDFEASYGRTSMEYYDGFVFGLYAEGAGRRPPVATGGRYDAMTAVLGGGSPVPAVGGVIRPDLVLELER